MSTIIATTLSNGSVSVPTATVVNGSAKAWASVNGTGTIAVRDSLNVSSLTDVGTGDFATNFSNAYSAGDYAIGGSTVGNTSLYSQITTGVVLPSAGSIRTITGRFDLSSGNIADQNYVSVLTFGDLA
jgi:hypothetical protein